MDRKELARQYRQRTQIGGVYTIKNTVLNKWYVDSTSDLKAARNRYQSMPESYLKIAADYQSQNGRGFVFEELESLPKDEQQTMQSFREDLAVLKSLWLDKLVDQELY